MIVTRVSQNGIYGRRWYVYVSEIDDMLASAGFSPDPGDYRLVGSRKYKRSAEKLAKRVVKDIAAGWAFVPKR